MSCISLKTGKKVCQSAKELILQPQSEIESVREFLREKGYTILAEDMVLEDGKFYPMMKVQYQGENAQKALEELKLSDSLWWITPAKPPSCVENFSLKKKSSYTCIKENLEKQPASEKNPDTACRSGRHTAL